LQRSHSAQGRSSTRARTFAGLLLVTALVSAMDPAVASEPSVTDPSERWVRHGFAEGWALASTDSDGDGNDEVVYGGRGVAMVDDRSLATGQPRWSFKWDDVPGNVLTGGDNMWATGIEMLDATGDDTPDAMVTTSDSAAYLLDGATGEKVWRSPTDGGLSNGFALVDADEDGVPDLFPSGSRTVLSGATGEKLWTAPIPKNARSVASGDFNGDGDRDTIITINPPGAGTNPNTIVPALTATTVFVVSSDGELLYDFEPYNGIESMAGADIDGDGADEAVLGTFNGFLHVIDAGGVRWSSFLGPSAVTALQVTDTDGDGRDEIFAGTGSGAGGLGPLFSVAAFGPEGAQRWRHVVPDPIVELQLEQLDGDDELELLVGGGVTGSAPIGSALALETGLAEPSRQMWFIETGQQVSSFAVLDGTVGKRVAIGSHDALMRVVDAENGSELAHWTSGGYSETVTATDLNGDGRDETVTGDHDGHIRVVDADGDELWSTKVPGGNNMTVAQVSTGDTDNDGLQEVAAAAEVRDRDEGGEIALYSRSGELRWSVPLVGFAQDVEFADLDLDGGDELVVAEGGRALGEPCAVGAYAGASGETLWRIELPTCIVIHADAADADGDGSPEIGFGTQVLYGTPQAGLVDADGSLLWHLQPPQASAWVDLEPGVFLHGGFADQSRGHLTNRSITTGEVRWQSFIEGERGNGGGANRFGVQIPDATGDGIEDVLTSSDSREVLLVDGGSGSRVWTTRIQPSEVPVTHAHQSGPVVYVAPDGADPVIFASQYSTGRQRSETFVLSLTGAIIDSFWMEGDAHAASPARFGPDSWGAVVAAGLGTYAYEIAGGDIDDLVPTTLELFVEGTGANRILRVSLKSSEHGIPVADRAVTLIADGAVIGSVITGSDGMAEMIAPPRYRGGHHYFEARFAGDDTYLPASAQATTQAP
jgi:outer membrane protein assembly factor BamB